MQSKIGLHGVLVADVVESRAHSRLRGSINEKLRSASAAHLDAKLIRLPYAVTAGDEFETATARLELIPRIILDLRWRLYPLELRIGVGIGTIQGPLRAPVNRAAGPAFEFARQAITDIRKARKYPTLTVFRSTAADFDDTANLVYGLHDTLLRQTTAKQWETIAAYMAKKRVDYTAKALGVAISTASRNLKRGHYWQMEGTAAVMERLIGQVFG